LQATSSSRASYGAFLAQTKPEVIHREEQNRCFIETLEKLTAKEDVSEAEAKLIEPLVVLVKQHEQTTMHSRTPGLSTSSKGVDEGL
jgi:hypothetical protein